MANRRNAALGTPGDMPVPPMVNPIGFRVVDAISEVLFRKLYARLGITAKRHDSVSYFHACAPLRKAAGRPSDSQAV